MNIEVILLTLKLMHLIATTSKCKCLKQHFKSSVTFILTLLILKFIEGSFRRFLYVDYIVLQYVSITFNSIFFNHFQVCAIHRNCHHPHE